MSSETPTLRFADLQLPEPLMRALADVGYESPSPIQAATIPDAVAGRDVPHPSSARNRARRRTAQGWQGLGGGWAGDAQAAAGTAVVFATGAGAADPRPTVSTIARPVSVSAIPTQAGAR